MYKLPQAPVLGSRHANTRRSILARTKAPAHMEQGSSVTYIVHPSSRQDPKAAEAWVKAMISAWAVGSASVSYGLKYSISFSFLRISLAIFFPISRIVLSPFFVA